MSQKFEYVVLKKKGKIATIMINRPKILNAMNSQTRKEIIAALDDVKRDHSVRALILTGAGDRSFSAGQDISESVEFTTEDAGSWVIEWDELYTKIMNLPIPVIAKIKGYAVGAGFQVALICDIRIASENVKVGMTEINIGIPCILGSYLINNVAGYMPAVELSLTGDLINGKRAFELGLLNKVVPMDELDNTVNELAKKLSEKPPISMESQKRWLNWFRSEFEEVSKRGQEIHSKVYASGEPKEYMAKFLEKSKNKG